MGKNMSSASNKSGWLRRLIAGNDPKSAQRANMRRQEMKAYWDARSTSHSHLEEWHSLAALEDEQAVNR